jgi:hypothetical protein
MTAFGATTGQNLTTILGGHTGTKTMDTFAFDDAGLESTFHDENSKLTKRTRFY